MMEFSGVDKWYVPLPPRYVWVPFLIASECFRLFGYALLLDQERKTGRITRIHAVKMRELPE